MGLALGAFPAGREGQRSVNLKRKKRGGTTSVSYLRGKEKGAWLEFLILTGKVTFSAPAEIFTDFAIYEV